MFGCVRTAFAIEFASVTFSILLQEARHFIDLFISINVDTNSTPCRGSLLFLSNNPPRWLCPFKQEQASPTLIVIVARPEL